MKISTEDVLAYARGLANDLQRGLKEAEGYMSSARWWQVEDATRDSELHGLVASALEFSRTYAGAESEWSRRAAAIVEGNESRKLPVATTAHQLGELLRAWASQIDAGVAEVASAAVIRESAESVTGLMEQVQALLDDRNVHPAAPIALAGAALELALRGAVKARALQVSGRPSISAYSGALRKADLITVQDAKDIESCGGMRNQAAHGEFDDLSRERAGLLQQQVNLLLRRLAEID